MRLGPFASFLRGRTLWLIAGALTAVASAQVWSLTDRPGLPALVLLGVGPVVVLAVTVTLAVWQDRWMMAAGVLAALSPSALWSLGRVEGAMAIVLACGAASVMAWAPTSTSTSTPIRAWSVGGLVVLGVGAWFARTESRIGPEPTWFEVAAGTGSTVRSAIAGSPDGGVVLGVAALIWVVAVGMLVGAAIVGDRPKPTRARISTVAWAVPVAAVVFVATAWAVSVWRGPPSAHGGTWVWSIGVAVAGASSAPGGRVRRRSALAVVVIVAAAWSSSLAQQARLDGASMPVVGGVALVPIVVPLVFWVRIGRRRRTRGVNVIGYLDVTSGLGERARTLVEALRAADIEVSEWPVDRTASPRRHEHTAERGPIHDTPIHDTNDSIYDTTVAVVTATEFGSLRASHGALLTDVDRVIGYWFWEVFEVPATHLPAIELLDEIWTPTRFVRDAYAAVADVPVRLVPLPIPAPARPVDDAAGSGIAADPFGAGDDTVFLVSFDHLSVMERKHPIGAIEAFRRAFPGGDEPVRLVIKTINADAAPADASRLQRAAAGDPRVRIWDEHLSDADLDALVAAADALVTLHRGEGLGLHPAQAMWLGTAVISSAYSGTLDLLDAGCALLVPVDVVPIVDGGDAYPPTATWGEPDLAAAAAAMRSVVEHPDGARALAAAALRRMERQPSMRATGRAVRRLLDGWASDAPGSWSSATSASVDSVASMQTTSAGAARGDHT